MRLWFTFLAGAAFLVLLAASARETRGAEDDQIQVRTVYSTHAQHRATSPHPPGDLLALWEARGSVELSSEAPPSTGWVPPRPRLQYGSVEIGGRSFLVALGHREGTRGVIGIDLDGDRGLKGEGEVQELDGRWSRQRGHTALVWTLPKKTVGTLQLELKFQQLARTTDAVVVTQSGPVPVALESDAPQGTRLLTSAEHVQYGHLSTAEGNLPAAFLRDGGERLTVIVDRNRNGVLGDTGETLHGVVGSRSAKEVIWKVEGVPHDKATAMLAYRESNPQAHVTYKAMALGARRGTIRRGSTDYALHIVDGDFDGRYGTRGDWWWFGPVDALKKFKRLLLDSMIEASEPFHVDAPWQLVTVGEDGIALLAKNRSAPPPHEYLHERTERVNETRWFPAFRRNVEFVKQEGIDLRRPKAASPPEWYHDVGLRETLRRAQAEGKPVLVDFEADWCKICKCWDYYVYADKEVAELLGRFRRLKINVDFNFGNDMAKYGGTNPPYLVFLDPSGQVLLSFPEVDQRGQETGRTVHGLGSFQRPRDFAETLRAALEACGPR